MHGAKRRGAEAAKNRRDFYSAFLRVLCVSAFGIRVHPWLKMALPDLIEIVPLAAPVRAEITVPGSKSITNRALILAALADGEVTLTGALWSEDTQIVVGCLKELGFVVHVTQDPD